MTTPFGSENPSLAAYTPTSTVGQSPVGDGVAIAEAAVLGSGVMWSLANLLTSPGISSHIHQARRIYALSLGKAAATMQSVFEEHCTEKWAGGLSVGHADTFHCAKKSTYITGAHPIPDESSQRAGETVLDFLRSGELGPQDVVLVGVSGGASSIACCPISPLTAQDLGEITSELLRSGLDVTSVNMVRQSVNALSGGRLADAIWPARCLSFVLVDNVQVGAAAVGSGPTYPPLATPAEVARTIRSSSLSPALRTRILDVIGSTAARAPRLDRVENFVVSGPGQMLRAACDAATSRGYTVVALTDSIQGEAQEVAKVLGAIFRHYAGSSARVCVLAAGEVTVSVPHDCDGLGGRCQELAWSMIPEIRGLVDAEFVAFATDGQDFLPGVGGARVNSQTDGLASRSGIDWRMQLEKHETFAPLADLASLLPGSPTGTNVCDLYVFTQCEDGQATR